MHVSVVIQKYKQWRDNVEPVINTYANHLIVIFAFSVPILTEARRTSLVLVLVLFLVRGRMFLYMRRGLCDPVVQAFALYFVVHVLWLLGSNDMSMAKKPVHDAAFMLLPLLFSTFIDPRYIPRIAGAFILGMLASVIVSYALSLDLIPSMRHGPHSVQQGTHLNPTPIYNHSHYGFMLALTSAAFFHRLLKDKVSKSYKVLMLILFIAVSFNIFILKGRSGYVLFGVYLIALMFLIYRSNFIKPLLMMIALISVSFSIAYQYSQNFMNRVDLTVRSLESVVVDGDYSSSLGVRVGILDVSSDLVVNHWMLGMGTGDQIKEVRKVIKREVEEVHTNRADNLQHTHNEYLNAVLQFGLIGLIVFINIPYQLLKYRNPDNDMRAMFILLGIGVLLYSFFDIFVIDSGVLFTVVTLCSIGLKNYTTNNTNISKLNIQQGVVYSSAMILFYFLKQI